MEFEKKNHPERVSEAVDAKENGMLLRGNFQGHPKSGITPTAQTTPITIPWKYGNGRGKLVGRKGPTIGDP